MHCQGGEVPPSLGRPVGPIFSHHKARVQAMGWFPVRDHKTRANLLPPPPPPGNRKGE